MSTTVSPTTATTTWNLDATHSTVGFKVKHLMISTVRGHFGDIKGTLTVEGDNVSTAKIQVEVATASIDTNVEQRDAHLRSPDFFDAATYPTITFVSKRAEQGGSADFRLIGDLTLHGVTKEIALDVTDEGRGGDPWGGQRAGFSATGKINRGDFGLTWNAALETGGVVVSDEVKLEIEVEFVKG